LDNGVIAHFNSSWASRVRRDDLLTVQVDGTLASAVAGLRKCWIQDRESTPMPIWNPDIPQTLDFMDGWQEVPDEGEYENAFKIQWELFLRHVYEDGEFLWTLWEGAKGVQLAELAYQSWAERRWVDVPNMKE
jgi:predicted dehydrogenase